MAIPIDLFVRRLIDSRLMTRAEVNRYLATFPSEKRPTDGDSLVEALLLDGRLTAYQASAILGGGHQQLVLGEFIVLHPIGKGGMGHVFKVRHQGSGTIAAIKILTGEALDSPNAVRRFHQEVAVASRLCHRNIVSLFDSGEENGTHYLVMEHVEGEDLAAMIHQHGPFGPRTVLDWMLQSARGLAYAHAKNVIHRDIKPGNLLLDRKGTIKILDLGLARIVEEPPETRSASTLAERLTRRGEMLGTADYVSPEQAVDTRTADHRSDIYSLGCTLYKLLTGRPIFEGDTIVSKLMAHCEDTPPRLAQHLRSVPQVVEDTYLRMVAKQPDDRFQSMNDTAAALDRCLAACPAEAEAPHVVLVGPHPAERTVHYDEFARTVRPDEFRSYTENELPQPDAGTHRGQDLATDSGGER